MNKFTKLVFILALQWAAISNAQEVYEITCYECDSEKTCMVPEDQLKKATHHFEEGKELVGCKMVFDTKEPEVIVERAAHRFTKPEEVEGYTDFVDASSFCKKDEGNSLENCYCFYQGDDCKDDKVIMCKDRKHKGARFCH